ncbi:NF038105 family protein [Acinetobacter junii]|uniref:NF038105 family protein n=1 Tax=Acinetobacter junii TaxID=40215 RepID=UPI0024B7B7DE|nr:NF038105 family protein [Acinetobacter junii]MDI9721866.1 NF038105 family protein [Acinetobacter junii]
MSTKNFDATPTPSEAISLEKISKENVQEAWKEYEAKPEYKEFNKHDMIESMQPSDKDEAKPQT